MEQLRVVDTPGGALTYILIKKRIKNLNLRIGRDGQAVVSVPMSCPASRADQFVREKSGWIARVTRLQEAARPELPPEPDRETCRQLLKEALDQVYPLIQPLGVAYPQLKLRRMKSQWGNCHWNQGYITLNVALVRCPEHLRRYVALHELVHFLQPNHGEQFYAIMDALMPQWKRYRKELKQYAGALDG